MVLNIRYIIYLLGIRIIVLLLFYVAFSNYSMSAPVPEKESEPELEIRSIIHDPTTPIYSDIATHDATSKKQKENTKVIELQSLFYSQKHKAAVINGTILKEGDVFDGVTIVSIKKNHVVLRFKQSSKNLSLSKQLIINSTTGVISE